jgi:uncharacterized protein (TIGR02145 family)
VDYAGGEETAGTKLKSTAGWNEGPCNGTDDFGFSALHGGMSMCGDFTGNCGNFFIAGYLGCWWSATEYDADSAWNLGMNGHRENVGMTRNYKGFLFSVRCVAD